MTVPTTQNTKTYTGDGSTVAFSFPYLFYSNSHLVVRVDGVTKTINTDYTVTGAENPSGGTVTFNTAPASSASVIIQRIVPYTQDTDLENFDGNPSDVTEKQFDLLAMQAQQLSEQLSRSITLPVGFSGNISFAEVPEDGRTPVYSTDDGGFINGPNASDIVSAQGYAEDAEAAKTAAEAAQTAAEAAQTAAEAAAALLPLNNFAATSPPTINDDSGDGYSIGSRWIDTTGDLEAWVCADATLGAAQWLPSTLTVDDLGSLAVLNEVTYANIATAAIASTAEIISGTSSKLVNAANLAALYYSTKLYQTTGTSVTIGTWTTLLFDTEAWDDAGWHSTSSNTDRITFDFTGRVFVIGCYAPNTPNNASYGARILKNGTVVARVFHRTSDPATENLVALVCCEIDVVPTDYIQLQGYNSNGTLTSGTGLSGTTFSARRTK